MLLTKCNFKTGGKRFFSECETDGSPVCGIAFLPGSYTARRTLCNGEMSCVIYQTYLSKNTTADNIQSSFDEALSEIQLRQSELKQLQQEITHLQTTKSNLLAEDFLKNAIGIKQYDMLMHVGFFDININNATYRIFKNGELHKYKKSIFGQKTEWKGIIKTNRSDSVPLYDGIATVYYHIINDAAVFDKEKKCGEITIEA